MNILKWVQMKHRDGLNEDTGCGDDDDNEENKENDEKPTLNNNNNNIKDLNHKGKNHRRSPCRLTKTHLCELMNFEDMNNGINVNLKAGENPYDTGESMGSYPCIEYPHSQKDIVANQEINVTKVDIYRNEEENFVTIDSEISQRSKCLLMIS